MDDKVCAVVVTYNRRELLRECLEAIAAQTRRPDCVLVVDNASVDGTPEMLEKELPWVKVLRLPENQGGAGGFHEGMKWAYERGVDWIWLMDDDGLPAPDALSTLLADKPLVFKGTLAIAKGTPDETSFLYKLPSGKLSDNVREILAAYPGGVIENYVTAFNGCLIHKRAIDKIGLPIKEFFIWGDEVEYTKRAKRAGVKMGTILSARFIHPKSRTKSVRILWFNKRLQFSEDKQRMFIIVRNHTIIHLLNKGMGKSVASLLLYSFIFPRKLPLIWKAVYDAIKIMKSIRRQL